MASNDYSAEYLATLLSSQLAATKDPETVVLLCKVRGLYIAADLLSCGNPKLARKLERAGEATLLRGYGVKNAPRGKRPVP